MFNDDCLDEQACHHVLYILELIVVNLCTRGIYTQFYLPCIGAEELYSLGILVLKIWPRNSFTEGDRGQALIHIFKTMSFWMPYTVVDINLEQLIAGGNPPDP